jgi:4-amino-4-deoxy-L-arabinose transferase-like glycosyltransferase
VNDIGSRWRLFPLRFQSGDLAVVVLALAVFFVWLGRTELLIPDEARHVEIGREMLASGSYIVPQLQGSPYYHKPAAHYWLVAASLSVFGHNEFAARLPTVLAALLSICAAVRFAAHAYSPSVARLLAIVLASMPAFVALGRFGILDMTLTAALTAGFSSLGIWWTNRRIRPPYAFYVFIGLAMLVKGPVSVAQGGIAVACLLLLAHRDPTRSLVRTLEQLAPLRGMAIVTTVALPWYAAAAIVDPGYIATFLFRHNMVRFVSAGPGAGHIEPWWYYALALPVLLLPWTPWVLVGLKNLRERSEQTHANTFCLVWVVSVAGVYLPAASKIATYLLPALVPLACIAASAIDGSTRRTGSELLAISSGARRWALAFCALVSAAGATAVVYILMEHPSLQTRLLAAVPALMSLPAVLCLRQRTAPQQWVSATVAASVCLLAAAYGLAGDVVGEFKGMRSLTNVLSTELPASTRLAAFRGSPHAATFYTGKLSRDLDSPEQILEWLATDTPSAVVIRQRHLSYLGRSLPPGIYQRWSNRGATILLSNVPPETPRNEHEAPSEPAG